MAKGNVDPKFKAFFDVLKTLLDQKPEEWAIKPELGVVNFSDVLNEIKNTRRILEALQHTQVAILPNQRLAAITNAMSQVGKTFAQMNTFNLAQPNPTEARNAIQSQILSSYNGLFEAAYPAVSSLLARDEFATLEAELRTRVDATGTTASELIKKLQETGIEAQQTLSAIKAASGQAGVAKEATHFAAEAKAYRKAAKWWAFATFIVAILAVMWGFIVLWWIPVVHDATPSEIVQHTVGKLIVFTALYYGLLWCARNYGANRHNYVVNKHKQNSLSTFESFVRAAEQDPSIKNAVLLQATTSIFASQVSGYAKQEADAEPPNKIIELVRSVAGPERPH